MSSRRAAPTNNAQADGLRRELEQLKVQNAQVEAAAAAYEEVVASVNADMPAFDQLTPTEQAAGSLGVHPSAWKPIKFMNASHFDTLIRNNALDDTLARRIEAFRQVATAAQ